MEDEKIVALYFERNEDAIQESEVKYGKYCHTISYNVLRNVEDTEECVNDTWIHAWNAIPPTRPVSLKAFLGKIARNLSLNRLQENHAQKRGNGENYTALEELDEILSAPRTVEEEVEGKLLKETIDLFLEGLSEKYRIVLMQRYWYFYSIEEIARLNGYTVNNVKSLLFRTRKRLKDHLEKEGVTL